MRLCKSVCKDCASGLLWPARSLNGVGLARFHGLIRIRVPSCDNKPAAQRRDVPRRPRWSACLTPGRYEELVTDVSDEIGRAKHRHDALGVPGRNVRADNVVGGLPLHGHNLAAVDGQDAVAETVQHPAVLETVRREAPSRSVHPSTRAEDLDRRCPARFPDSSAASKEDSLRGPSLLVEWFLVFL